MHVMKRIQNVIDSLIYLFVGPFTVVGTVPLLLMGFDATMGLPHFTSDITIAVGYILMNLAAIVALWCTWLMHRGAGTPIPSMPAQQLVRTGAYAVVRQPMMLTLLVVGLGELLVTGSLLMLLWIPLAMRAGVMFIIVYEEPLLLTRYGEPYQRYCDEVPRWLPQWKQI
ncbi:MAG: isoprenylcysteine carboxylmethyltransferase family protein [Mariprofundaceae bacterium]|nr:isoprenylcysteine carboxylmethyltransferase family protein [Mariprofundaceae bacterium]